MGMEISLKEDIGMGKGMEEECFWERIRGKLLGSGLMMNCNRFERVYFVCVYFYVGIFFLILFRFFC